MNGDFKLGYQISVDKKTGAVTLLSHGVTLSKDEMESIVKSYQYATEKVK